LAAPRSACENKCYCAEEATARPPIVLGDVHRGGGRSPTPAAPAKGLPRVEMTLGQACPPEY
jgi:hypothetical protein